MVARMGIYQCSVTEVIDILGLAPNTIYDACQRVHSMSLATFLDIYRAHGRASLRRKQFKVAMTGNVTMLRWLGIQYLDQSPEVVMLHRSPGTGEQVQDQPQAAPSPSGFSIAGLPAPQPQPEPAQPSEAAAIPTTGRTVG